MMVIYTYKRIHEEKQINIKAIRYGAVSCVSA